MPSIRGMSVRISERPSPTTPSAPAQLRSAPWEWIAAGSWIGLLVIAHLQGRPLAEGPRVILGAPPIAGSFEPRFTAWALPALGLALLLVRYLPRVAAKFSWTRLLAACWIAAGAWALALALVDGPSALTAPLRTPWDYLVNLRLIDGPGAFISGFTENLHRYSIHAQGHPPGFLLLLWGLDQFELCKPPIVAGMIIAAGASTGPAALLSLRELSGEKPARAAAPFIVLAPAAIWIATSADAFYAGVAAWAVTLLVLASGRSGRSAGLFGLAGGALFGLGLYLSYGLVLIGLIPAAVLIARRRFDVGIRALAGAALVATVFTIAGFWWPEGLSITRVIYADGIAAQRPYLYFLFAGIAAFALSTGPALFAGIATGPHARAVRLLAGAAGVAVVLAALSGFSKGEVERIWLFLVPWAVLASAAIPEYARRKWLAGQVLTALTVQLMVITPW
jgi:hypothetical protein